MFRESTRLQQQMFTVMHDVQRHSKFVPVNSWNPTSEMTCLNIITSARESKKLSGQNPLLDRTNHNHRN